MLVWMHSIALDSKSTANLYQIQIQKLHKGSWEAYYCFMLQNILTVKSLSIITFTSQKNAFLYGKKFIIMKSTHYEKYFPPSLQFLTLNHTWMKSTLENKMIYVFYLWNSVQCNSYFQDYPSVWAGIQLELNLIWVKFWTVWGVYFIYSFITLFEHIFWYKCDWFEGKCNILIFLKLEYSWKFQYTYPIYFPIIAIFISAMIFIITGLTASYSCHISWYKFKDIKYT